MKNPVFALVAVCAVSAGAVVDVRPPALAQHSPEPLKRSRQGVEPAKVRGPANRPANPAEVAAAPQGQQEQLDPLEEAAASP